MLVFVFFVHSAHLLSYDLGGNVVSIEWQDRRVRFSNSGEDACAFPNFHDREYAEAMLNEDGIDVLRSRVKRTLQDIGPES